MKIIHIPLPVYSSLLATVLLSQVAAQTSTNTPSVKPGVPATPAAQKITNAPPVAPVVPVAPAAQHPTNTPLPEPVVPTAPEPQNPTNPVPAAPEAPAVSAGPPGPAVPPTRVVSPPAPTVRAEQLQSFKFEQADLDLVMMQYCAWTDKIYLKNETVKATISVKADKRTVAECIEIIEAILAMNDIALVPMGEDYIKVVAAQDTAGRGVPVVYPDQKSAGSDKMVTKIFPLKNAINPEMEKAVRQMMHMYGLYLPLESSNSLMITDTEINIQRIGELLEFLDQATAAMESRIYQIEYAEATEIAVKLTEIVAMAQEGQKTTTTVYGNPNARTPPGVVRAGTSQRGGITRVSQSGSSGAPIIQGTVKVMPDERTNLILIFSQEENFEFFDRIIKVLDVEVDPAISFEVINLEYADAEELSGTLNELVGAAQSAQRGQTGSTRTSSSRTSSSVNRSSTSRRVTPNAQSGALRSLARLSENTKILADQRSNAILLMGEKGDIDAIKDVISSLDVMLEQVMIEAAIFEVTLGDELEHGIEWLYQSQGLDKVGAWDGVGLITNAAENVAAGALSYYQNLVGIDSKLAIKLAAGNSDVRLLSTPVIMTTDNTEARLSVAEQRPIVTGTQSYANSSGTQSSTYSYKDIGIQLTVTPHINPQRLVVMEILQKADQVGDEILIDGNPVPVILSREFEAMIAVPDRGSIALGGLINSEVRDSVNKIPILGDIPFIGRYLFSSVKKENRQTELIVLMTPYVLVNNTEALDESTRRYDAINMKPEDWPVNGWSDSTLQDRPKPFEEKE